MGYIAIDTLSDWLVWAGVSTVSEWPLYPSSGIVFRLWSYNMRSGSMPDSRCRFAKSRNCWPSVASTFRMKRSGVGFWSSGVWSPAIFDGAVHARARAGISTRWSSRPVIENTGFGGRSMTRTKCLTPWFSGDAVLDRQGDCCGSGWRSRVLRRSVSPRTSSNHTTSPFG